MLSQKEVAHLRARWPADVVTNLNTRMIRLVKRAGVWQKAIAVDELRRMFPSHERDGETYVDLRGITFYALREVDWDHVDLSYAAFRSGVLGPGLVGGGALGNPASKFARCLFCAIHAESNIQGRYDDCSFDGAKLRRAHFWHDARFTDCSFRRADMSGARLTNGVKFIRCDFSAANLQRADLSGSTFEECNFDDSKLDLAGIMSVRFIRCSMQNVSRLGIVSDPKRNVFDGTDVEPF